MKKTREITKKDIADAALIAQLIGGADIAGAPFTCVEQERRRLHSCPDCDHFVRVAKCDHRGGEWECIASAIGASPQALELWMAISNAFFTSAKDRQDELHYFRTEEPKELQEREQLYAWVDSIRKGGINHGRGKLGLSELEIAEVLRDGHLPPGWRVVTKHRKPQIDADQNKPSAILAAKGLPMVRVNMTAGGPQVQSCYGKGAP